MISRYSDFGDEWKNSIVRTADGGQSWQISYRDPHVVFDDIAFPSEQAGWAVGHLDSTYQMVILHTADGGVSWSIQISDSIGSPDNVFFLNEQEGWISIERSIMHTMDGGASWQWYSAPASMYFDLYFADSQNGWGTSFREIYHTTDGGQTWIPLNVPVISTEMTHSTAVIDENTIWTVTSTDGAHEISEHILYTADGGQNWTRYNCGSLSNLNDIVFADEQYGWICGEHGTVLQTDDGGSTWTQRCGNSLTEQSYYRNLDFADRQNGWMVGSPWTPDPILHTSDGGVHWNAQYSDTTQTFSDIAALSTTNVWAVGTVVLHSTDGGENWSTVDVGNTAYCWNIVCPDDQVIWIFSGGTGINDEFCVHRSIDGGESWETHDVPLHLKYACLAAGDADNVWVAGYVSRLDEGMLIHSADGGVTWETQCDGLGNLRCLCFVDALNGWVGVSQGLAHTTDGGDTWTILDFDFESYVDLVMFSDTQNGWAIVSNRAYRTQDGGVTWERFDHFAGFLTDIEVLDVDHAWISGYSGTLLRFDGTVFDTPEPQTQSISSTYALYQNYPNPFNPSTTISFSIPKAGHTSLIVYDLLGRTVETLVNKQLTAGNYHTSWNAGALPSGVYFYRLTSGEFSDVKKTVLLK